MGFSSRLIEAGRRLDRALYEKTGLNRLVGWMKPKIPPPVRSATGRYGPLVAVVLAVALFALALSGPDAGRVVTTAANEASAGVAKAPQTGAATIEPGSAAQNAASSAPKSRAKLREIARQLAAPTTSNVCGTAGLLDTGSKVQYPYAVQCLSPFSGDNGGETYRGVYRNKIRVAVYVTRDPTVIATTNAADAGKPTQGCSTTECWIDWTKAFVEWFSKYYLTYGRAIEVVPVEGSGSEGNVELAIQDARTVKNLNPPVFASLGGPGEAGPAYARELKSAGILCFCTASLPQDFYEKEMTPYVWSTLMASTQAYVHRAQYVGERLANRPAKWHGDAAVRNRTRSFALVWFDNTQGDYKSGVDFFEKVLKDKYGVTLKPKIRYENIQGCQTDAANIGLQLLNSQATSVIFSGDPICPITLTKQMENQQAKWEWIITGSALTDTNTLARLYDQNQWSRAFGVSMLAPAVKDENTYYYRMFKEVRPNGEWKVNIPLALAAPANFFRGEHLAGAILNPNTFRDGMARAIPRGGTATLPLVSYGPKTLPAFGLSFWDYNSYDDMTEIWWDNTATDANGTARAYRYVDAAKRYQWGTWPSTEPKPFIVDGTITGFQKAPDQ